MTQKNTPFWKLSLLLGALSCCFVLAGCPEPEEEGNEEVTEAEGECRKNIDCGAGSICQKETDTDEWGTCLKLVLSLIHI